MNPEKMLRAAVIGLGNIGFLFDLDSLRKTTWSHVAAYERSCRTTLVGAVEVDDRRGTLFHERYGAVPVYSNVSDLMNHCSPDIVSICTPTQSHRSVLEELIQHPSLKGIFCEKPLSSCIEDASEMVDKCKEKGIALAVNHTRRWDDRFLYVQRLIQSGEIGKMRTINMIYPGQIFNIGTHLLDTLRMLTGKEPVRVSGMSANPHKDDPDISGWLEFNDNTIATMASVGKREDLVFEMDFIGEKGRVKVLDNGETIKRYSFEESTRYSGYKELKRVTVGSIKEKDRLVEAVDDLASVIAGEKEEVNCTGNDGLAALKLTLALLESAQKQGMPVTVSLK